MGQVGAQFRHLRADRRARRPRGRGHRLARGPVRGRRADGARGLSGVRGGGDVRPGARVAGGAVASVYAACASGAQAIDTARAQILAGLADVALVVGADAAPKGFFAPAGGERPDDPDWLRFRVLGATNPAYFGLYARRRMALYGDTPEDFARVKVKNSAAGALNEYARYRDPVTAEEVAASAMVADPLRLLDICATSDGAAALVLSSMEFARHHGARDPVRIRAVSTVTPTYPRTVLDLPDIGTDSAVAVDPPRELPRLDRAGRVRGGGDRAGGPLAGRGLRPVHRPGAGVVRGPRALWSRRGSEAAADRGDRAGRPDSGERERRSGLVRRGGPRPGRRAGMRAHPAVARTGRGAADTGRTGRHHGEPGAVRARLGGGGGPLSRPPPTGFPCPLLDWASLPQNTRGPVRRTMYGPYPCRRGYGPYACRCAPRLRWRRVRGPGPHAPGRAPRPRPGRRARRTGPARRRRAPEPRGRGRGRPARSPSGTVRRPRRS